ncbi:MAG: hypothetical protein AAF922_12615 [Pseudomonadota bacterium]
MKKIVSVFKYLILPFLLVWVFQRMFFFSKAEMLRRVGILGTTGELGDIGTYKRWFRKAKIIVEVVEVAEGEPALSIILIGFHGSNGMHLDGLGHLDTDSVGADSQVQILASFEEEGDLPSVKTVFSQYELNGWYRVSGETTVFAEEGFWHERLRF